MRITPPVSLAIIVLALGGCVVQGAQPPVQAGNGLQDNKGTLSVDTGEVPVLPNCAVGQLVGKGANGWECFTPAQPDLLKAGDGISVENNTISFNAATVPARDVWNGTVPYSQVTGAPDLNWSTVGPSVKSTDPWPGTIDYSQVENAPLPYTDEQAAAAAQTAVTWSSVKSSVQATDQWPGTVAYAQVTGTPAPYTDAQAATVAQAAVGWSTVKASVKSTDTWPGTVPYNEVTGAPAPYTDAQAQAAVKWSSVSQTVTSTTPWPGTIQYSQVANPPADLGALATAVSNLQTQLNTTNTNVSNLQTQLSTANSNVSNLQTQLSTANTNVSNLQTQLSTANTSVSNLQTQLATANTSISNLQSQVAALQAGTCPSGYSRDTTTLPSSMVLCTKTLSDGSLDQVVKVADFWIDRFELSTCNGGSTGDATGSGVTATACSVNGVTPTSNIDWFQSEQLCANAGKDLCTNAEWQMAELGTNDPGPSTGANGLCNTNNMVVRTTGQGSACRSRFGAEDMVGNLGEWVSDWGEGGPTWQTAWGQHYSWPAQFGGDGVFNINGTAQQGGTNYPGLPSAYLRGGKYDDAQNAGAFMLDANHGPADSQLPFGARCCMHR